MKSLIDTQTKEISTTRAVYQTICYFDIFKYPLKQEEIIRFCNEKIEEQDLQLSLNELISKKKIMEIKGYYLLAGSAEKSIENRIENEIYLTRKLPIIKRYAKLICSFPFVEAVFISGSVSKGLLNKDGDVDYFIISKPGRVWLCRTLLVAFKKIVLLNSRKYFCVNYFIDTQNLVVPDNNLFVATEIKTLIPVVKNTVAQNFLAANSWSNSLFPNFNRPNEPLINDQHKKSLAGLWVEKMLSRSPGASLDNYFFKKTLQRWQKKFPHFNPKEFDLNMRSYKNVSKHHPQGYQLKVLNALNERMSNFE